LAIIGSHGLIRKKPQAVLRRNHLVGKLVLAPKQTRKASIPLPYPGI